MSPAVHPRVLCPVCGGEKVSIYIDGEARKMTPAAVGSSRSEVASGRILRCQSCRFGFRETRQSDEELAELYEKLDTTVYESETAGRIKSASGYFKMIQKYVPNPGRILDVGCASGLFLRCAQDENWEIVGIEPSEELAEKARQLLSPGAQVYRAMLQSVSLPTASFDVVTLWDVLEHVPDPVPFLRLAGSLLKSGGHLFANVPNLDSIQARALGRKWPLLLPEHLNYFNLQSLRLCGVRAGLKWIISCQRMASFSVGYVLYRLQQHRIPGTSLAYRAVSSTRIKNFVVPVPLGETCGVWTR